MICNLKVSNETAVMIEVFGGLDIIYIGNISHKKTMTEKILEHLYTCLHNPKIYKVSAFTSVRYYKIQKYVFIFIYS